MRIPSIVITLLALFGTGVAAFGWGGDVHRLVNMSSLRFLPPAMARLIADSSFITQHASDADWRKDSKDTTIASEETRHYIDIDDYPEYRTMPRDFGAVVALYGWMRVKENGVLPWAAGWTYDSLVAQLRRGAWNSALQSAADLGHYVADAHQPLHTTKNYNGQLSGNYGVHSRYESTMLNAQHFFSSLSVRPDSVRYIADRVGYMFDIVLESITLIDTIFHADDRAKQAAGWSGSGTVPESYYTALWQHTREMTLMQVQRAGQALANLWYSAWIDAGLMQPASIAAGDRSAGYFGLHGLFPNPARDRVLVRYGGGTGDVSVELYAQNGTRLTSFNAASNDTGLHAIELSISRLPAGMYFVALRSGTHTASAKLLIAR